MNSLQKKIDVFLQGPLLTSIQADVHHFRASVEERFNRVDRGFVGVLEGLREQLNSMNITGGGLVPEAMKRAEMVRDEGLGNLGVGLELGKKKVKEMLFKFKGEGRLIGISGMGGSGKTTLAKELQLDDELQCQFDVLFVTVSQSPDLEDLRSRIWEFLTRFEVGCGASLPDSIVEVEHEHEHEKMKLVILDDVWTRECLDRLMFRIPGSTTLVVSRSKLADPKDTYDVELLREDEAISLFCLSAFGQQSIPSRFNRRLVEKIVDESKGLPLSLKVLGSSLKNRPGIYWEAIGQKLSKGEAADESLMVFGHIETSLEILDPQTRECFLDLSAFPEDVKIPLDVLINMWIELYDLNEKTAFANLINLLDRNLLTLVENPRYGTSYTGYYGVFVMQHDVLRDLALHLSNREKVNRRERLVMPIKESVLPREWERNKDEPYDARIISIHTGEMNEMDWFDMDLPKTEVLILNFSSSDSYVLPPFIAKMGRLRALVIINRSMTPARLHNFSICNNLAKLRSLWLERVHVPELLSSLKNLQKMSLIFCKINNSFEQTSLDLDTSSSQIFPNLSDLTIDHCDDLVELPTTICEMTSLNSISITNCPCIRELPKNLSKLQALTLLRLYACPELKSLPNEICELPHLKYIDISQCVSLNSIPEEIGKLKTLEKIYMRECSLMDLPNSAVLLSSLRHVICDRESFRIWEKVENAVPGLYIEVAEENFSLA